MEEEKTPIKKSRQQGMKRDPVKKTVAGKPTPKKKAVPKKKVAPKKKAVPKKKVKPEIEVPEVKEAELAITPEEELEEVYDILSEDEEAVPEKAAQIPADKEKKPSLKMYRRIAIGFVVVTVLLLAVVVLLSTIKAKIKVIPKIENIETEFIADITEGAESAGEIPGRVFSLTLEEAREFTVSLEGATEIPSKAGGMVTIYNTSGSDQPLVASTRLLTPDGVLFRIDEAVVVPAGGTVEVMAHADQEGKDGEIEASTFTIPGLNSARQKEVYAKSTEPMTGGVEYLKVVTEEDLENASTELADEMLESAKPELESMVSEDYTGETFLYSISEKVSDTVPGEEAESFTISLTLEVIGVFYDKEALVALAEAKLFESLPRGYELIQINRDDIEITVERVDAEEELANVRVKLDGAMIVSPTNILLSKDSLIGLGPEEVANNLIEAGIAVDVEVTFSPFFIKKVPRLKDHIEIQIETP